MDNRKLLPYVAFALLLLAACKKDGDTIINNYGSEPGTTPKRTMLKAYGFIDSTQVLRFTYQNDQIGKLKEFTSYDNTGTATAKVVILYNGSNQATGYQSYTLPANTLEAQGTFRMDGDGHVVEVLQRNLTGDTLGIGYYQYDGADYQPTSFYFYDKPNDRNSVYEYYTYDKNGNIIKAISYKDNGTDPLYKASETEASGFGKGINGLNQLYYYLIASQSSYGFSTSSALYFSNYFPKSLRTQNYKPNGNGDGVSISNLEFKLDNNNNVIQLMGVGSSTPIFLQY